MGGKEIKKRNTMKANSHSQGCGSCVCLFVCLVVSLRNKNKTNTSGQEAVATALI